MKLIKVDCCEHCSLRERQNYFDNFCTHPATDGMELTDLSIIHPDCPLENDGYVNLLKSFNKLNSKMFVALYENDNREVERLLGIMEQALVMALDERVTK